MRHRAFWLNAHRMLGFVLALPERRKPDRPLTATEFGAVRELLEEVIVTPVHRLNECAAIAARKAAAVEGEERLSAAKERLAAQEAECVRTGPAQDVLRQLRTSASLSPAEDLAVAYLLEGLSRP